jgi:hypothetical protein
VSKVKIVALAVAMVLLGAIVGGLAASVHWTRQATAMAAAQAGLGVAKSVRVLEQLRGNKPEAAVRALEFQLDTDIITLAAYAKGDTAHAEISRIALRKAGAYRKGVTYTSPFEEAVGKALALGDTK